MKVPNAQLRDAYLRRVAEGKVKPSQVAHRMDWWLSDSRGDTSRVRRTLGVIEDTTCKGQKRYRKKREFIDEQTALRLADAIGVDPTDVGLGDVYRRRVEQDTRGRMRGAQYERVPVDPMTLDGEFPREHMSDVELDYVREMYPELFR